MVHIEKKGKKWIEIQSTNKSSHLFEPWTEENEKALGDLDKHRLYLQDTQMGRLEAQQQIEF